MIYKSKNLFDDILKIFVQFWTEIFAETKITSLAGTEIGILVQV